MPDAVAAAWLERGYAVLDVGYIGGSKSLSHIGIPSSDSILSNMVIEIEEMITIAHERLKVETQIQHDKNLIIIGNSFGGIIALQLAQNNRANGVLLLMPICDLQSQLDHLNSDAPGWGFRAPYRRFIESNLETSESCDRAVQNETPLFIVQGENDQNVGSTSQLALDRSLAARGSATLVKRPGSDGHMIDLAYLSTVVDQADRWFAEQGGH